jgi:hypothetical protein
MRKAVATVLYLFTAAWMVLASLVVLSVSSWVADPQFYKDIAGEPKLYEAMGDELYSSMAQAINEGVAQDLPGGLDEAALAAALKANLPPMVLAEAGSAAVDSAFGMTRTDHRTWLIDLKPVKAAFVGDRLPAIAASYTKALPEGSKPAAGAKVLEHALAAAVAAIPDTVETDPETGAEPAAWQPVAAPVSLGGMGSALWSGSLIGLVVSLGFVFALALLASPTWAGRAGWSGAVLLVPTILVLVIGAVGWIVSDAALVSNLGGEIARQIQTAEGGGAEAVLGGLFGKLLGETLRTATQGFLWTGLAGLGVCVALIGVSRVGGRDDDDGV